MKAYTASDRNGDTGYSIMETIKPETNCSEFPNNSDTISRQAAIDAIVNTVSKIGLHDNSEVARYGATFRQHEIIDIIEGVPSAQPEIVRCKDCKYMTEHYDTDGNVPYWTCSEWDSGTDYDGFCHYAERREE